MKRVALSGALDGLNRTAFREAVEAGGWAYATSLEEGVAVLVTGDRALQSKVAKARELGIEVLSWAAFQARLAPEATVEEVPLAQAPTVETLPAVALGEGHLRVLDVAVAVRERVDDVARIPAESSFAHYTLDGPTVRLLRFVARAVRLGHPCLLEGETATSKTSGVMYLASRLGQPVVRLNLNGQTDASELVGRYVPDGAGWRFQEGPVPQAMRQGWWLILDEVNLAEPAVLERLNPVLERVPTLVLSEGDGSRIGGGGVPVHSAFRVFATMNPAEYQGRSVLSPAWRDRFVATWRAEVPGELEYRQMLERLVFGGQPAIEALGLTWAAAESDPDPPFRSLAEVGGIGGLLARVAALHAAVVAMATSRDGQAASLGAHRRERYIFSRRGLLGFLDALRSLTLIDPITGVTEGLVEAPVRLTLDALERTYVDRVRGDDDRGRIHNLLRSLGLSRDDWVDPFEAG